MKLLRFFPLYFLVFVLFSQFCNAQKDFRSGWIVTMAGDTLHGKIDYRNDLYMSMQCNFKGKDSSVENFAPEDVASFKIEEDRYFTSREVETVKVFLEYMVKGKVNMYYLRTIEGDKFFIDKEGLVLTEIPFEIKIVNKNDKSYKYESKRHIGVLKYFMQDAPDLEKSISKMKTLEYRKLVKLGKKYHSSICEDNLCLEYSRKIPTFKFSPELLMGIVKFKEFDNLVNQNYFLSGLLINIWMPRLNEKIYFRTGAFYAPVKLIEGDETFNYIKIPTHIAYIASDKFLLRPSVSIGLLTPSYSAGLSARLSDHAYLGIQSWFNFEYELKNPWRPKDLLNYFLLGNFYIKF